jgi:TonB family protein
MTMRVMAAGLALLCSSASAASEYNKQIDVDLKSCDKPVWPRESLYKGEAGTVTLSFLIGPDGAVLESKVLQSSGFPMLDVAARDGLEKCKFTATGRKPEWTKMQYVWYLVDDGPAEDGKAKRARVLADAEYGDAAAQYRAATMLVFEKPADIERGMQFLRRAAERGLPEAQENLGMALMSGKLVPRDLVAAETWLRRAADHGSPSAQALLGEFLLNWGTNSAEGMEWLRKAAAQADPMGQTSLAVYLLAKEIDLSQAVALLQSAVNKQNHFAEFLLVQCYEVGHGVPVDLAKSTRLYERAAAAGVPDAEEALKELKSAKQ